MLVCDNVGTSLIAQEGGLCKHGAILFCHPEGSKVERLQKLLLGIALAQEEAYGSLATLASLNRTARGSNNIPT